MDHELFLKLHSCLLLLLPSELRNSLSIDAECNLKGLRGAPVLPVLNTGLPGAPTGRPSWSRVLTEVFREVLGIVGLRRRPLDISVEFASYNRAAGGSQLNPLALAVPAVAFTLQGLFTRSYCAPRIAAFIAATIYSKALALLAASETVRSESEALAAALQGYLNLQDVRGLLQGATILSKLSEKVAVLTSLERLMDTTLAENVHAGRRPGKLKGLLRKYREEYRELINHLVGGSAAPKDSARSVRIVEVPIELPMSSGNVYRMKIKLNTRYINNFKAFIGRLLAPQTPMELGPLLRCSYPTPAVAVVLWYERSLNDYWSQIIEYTAALALLAEGYKPLKGHRSLDGEEVDFAGYREDELVVVEAKTTLRESKLKTTLAQACTKALKVWKTLEQQGVIPRKTRIIVVTTGNTPREEDVRKAEQEVERCRELREKTKSSTELRVEHLYTLTEKLCNIRTLIRTTLCNTLRRKASSSHP